MEKLLNNLFIASKEDSKVFNRVGIIFYHINNIIRSIDCFENYLMYNPDDTDGYNNLGIAYYYIGNKEKSLYYFGKSVKLNETEDNSSILVSLIII
jgi:tetratricopeptide (TPR) repeat protein